MKKTNKFFASALAGVMAISMVGGITASAEINSIKNNENYTIAAASTYSSSLMSVIHSLFNFPRYLQEYNSNECWAECARGIINYKLSTNYTVNDMKNRVNMLHNANSNIFIAPNGSASDYTVIALLDSYLPSSYRPNLISSDLSYAEIKSHIDNDEPAIMLLRDSSNSIGHMVVLTGYATALESDYEAGISYGDYTGITFMNPQTGTEDFYHFFENDGTFSYVNSNGTSLYWRNTIVIS